VLHRRPSAKFSEFAAAQQKSCHRVWWRTFFFEFDGVSIFFVWLSLMAYVFFWVWWRIYLICLVEFDCVCFCSPSSFWLCTFSFEFDGVSIFFVRLSWIAYIFVPPLEFDCERFLLSLMAFYLIFFVEFYGVCFCSSSRIWLCKFPLEFDGVSVWFVWLTLIVCVFVPLLEFDCVCFLLSLMAYLYYLSGWVWLRMFLFLFYSLIV